MSEQIQKPNEWTVRARLMLLLFWHLAQFSQYIISHILCAFGGSEIIKPELLCVAPVVALWFGVGERELWQTIGVGFVRQFWPKRKHNGEQHQRREVG